MDLHEFMETRRAEIEQLIFQKLSSGPQKIQFSAELTLYKPRVATDAETTH